MSPQSFRTRIAFGCFASIAVATAAVGLRYLLSPRIMLYHQQALGVSWESLRPREQGLLLALLKGTGLCALVTSNAITTLLIPLRRGERWARWAIAGLCLNTLVPASWIAVRLAAATGAATPWPFLLGAIALVVVGFWLARPIDPDRGEGPARELRIVDLAVAGSEPDRHARVHG
jgi:hypothetical protein